MSNARANARLIGDKRYTEEYSCGEGHARVRYTANGSCVECQRQKNITRYWSDHAAGKAYSRNYKRKRTLPAPTRPEPEACELCGGDGGIGRALALDHCHQSGKFRGWLCHRCNVGLGHFSDDAALLRRAADYLSRGEP